jgi:hypothetical protein
MRKTSIVDLVALSAILFGCNNSRAGLIRCDFGVGGECQVGSPMAAVQYCQCHDGESPVRSATMMASRNADALRVRRATTSGPGKGLAFKTFANDLENNGVRFPFSGSLQPGDRSEIPPPKQIKAISHYIPSNQTTGGTVATGGSTGNAPAGCSCYHLSAHWALAIELICRLRFENAESPPDPIRSSLFRPPRAAI